MKYLVVFILLILFIGCVRSDRWIDERSFETMFEAAGGIDTEVFAPEIRFENNTFYLSTLTEDAVMRYSLDDASLSCSSGFEYLSPITIEKSVTLRAITCKEGLPGSAISVRTIENPCTWTGIIKGVIGTEITNDSSGTLYIAGHIDELFYNVPVNFGASWGNEDTRIFSEESIFITRINSDGTYGYTRTVTSNAGDILITSIDTDSGNNLYICGQYQGEIDFAGDWGASDIKPAPSNYYIGSFIMKISRDGDYQWTRVFQSSDHVSISANDVHAGGSVVYLTGTFAVSSPYTTTPESELDYNFAQDWDLEDIKQVNNAEHAFVTFIESDGSYGWTKRLGEVDSRCSGVAVTAATDETVYISGLTYGPMNFAADWEGTDYKDTNITSAFITKINYNGSYGWTKLLVHSDEKRAIGIGIYALETDGNDNIYIGGTSRCYDCIYGYDWGADDTINVNSSAFLTQIDNSGVYIDTFSIGGQYTSLAGIAFDSESNYYLSGSAFNTGAGDLDPGPGVDSNYETGHTFIAKFDDNDNFQWGRTQGIGYIDTASGLSIDSEDSIYFMATLVKSTSNSTSTVLFDEEWVISDFITVKNEYNTLIMKIAP